MDRKALKFKVDGTFDYISMTEANMLSCVNLDRFKITESDNTVLGALSGLAIDGEDWSKAKAVIDKFPYMSANMIRTLPSSYFSNGIIFRMMQYLATSLKL